MKKLTYKSMLILLNHKVKYRRSKEITFVLFLEKDTWYEYLNKDFMSSSSKCLENQKLRNNIYHEILLNRNTFEWSQNLLMVIDYVIKKRKIHHRKMNDQNFSKVRQDLPNLTIHQLKFFPSTNKDISIIKIEIGSSSPIIN